MPHPIRNRVGHFGSSSKNLDGPNVLSRKALGAFGDIEINGRAFGQRLEALALNGGVMHKDVWPTLLRDEAEALGVVEPLDSTCGHYFGPPSE